jgi:pimeloyl-ACP methyl ester carboxylesterase
LNRDLPLVLLPGVEGDAGIFEPLAPLARRRELIALDLPARGDTLAAIAAALLPQIAAPRFAIFGLSLGGLVGRALLSQAPGRVAGLITLNTLPDRSLLPAGVARAPAVLGLLPAGVFSRVYRRRIARRHLEEGLPAALSVQLLDRLPGRDTLIERLRAIDRWGLDPVVSAPHLVLRAQVDTEAPWTLGEAQAAHPRARVMTVPGGHRAPATHPGPLVGLLAEQLDAWGL